MNEAKTEKIYHPWLYREIRIGDRVTIETGNGHQRIRRGDTGTVIALTAKDGRIKVDRTQRHAWVTLENFALGDHPL